MSRTRSYWQTTAGPFRNACDAVVVGAGITGTSAAYWLRRLSPGLRIILLDQSGVAAGASGRNAGFLLGGTSRSPLEAADRLGRERVAWYHRFAASSIRTLMDAAPPERCELARQGSMLAAGDEEEAEGLRQAAAMLRGWGEEVQYHAGEEVHGRLRATGFYGGLFDPAGAAVNPVRLVRWLADASGAVVCGGQRVRAVERQGDLLNVVSSVGGFRAPIVILALNAYLPLILPETASLVRPVRAQMLAARAQPEFRLPYPVYSHRGFYYARSAPDGTLLVGGARHLHEAEEVGFDDATTPDLQNDLEQYVQAHFPAVQHLRVVRRWSGTMGFSPDGLPLVGRTSEGALWAGGFTGHGMAFGFGIGRLLAQLALEQDEEGQAKWFHPERLRSDA